MQQQSQLKDAHSFPKGSNSVLLTRVLTDFSLQVAGWVIVCGFGVFFACIALILVWIDVKFAGHTYNSEQFNTAGRSVKAGLIGVDIVSHFTWASILLACVSLTYLNGVSNSMW